MLNRRIVLGVIRSNLKIVAAFFVGLLVLSSLSLLGTMVSATYLRTVENDVRSTYGGFRYLVGSTTYAGQERLSDEAKEPDFIKFIKGNCTLSDTNKITKVDLIKVGGNLQYSQLLAGRFQNSPNEVVLSRQLADLHNLELGSQITCDKLNATVVGISVLPARTSELFIVTKISSDEPSETSGYWYTNTNPENDPRLKDLESNNFGVISVEGNIQFAQESVKDSLIRVWDAIAYILIVAVGVLLFTAFSVFSNVTYKLRIALEAAGMAKRKTYFLTITPLLALSFTAVLLGSLCTHLLGFWLAQPLGSYFDHYWLQIEWTGIKQGYLGIFISCLAAVAVGLFWARIRTKFAFKTDNLSSSGKSIKGLSIFTLLMIGFGVASAPFAYTHPLWNYTSVIALAMGLGLTGFILAWLPYGKPLRIAGYRSGTPAISFTPIIAVVCAIATTAGTHLWMQNKALSGGNLNAGGYVAISSLTQTDVDYLQAKFPEMITNAIVFAVPEKPHAQIRIGSEQSAQCNEATSSDNPACKSFTGLFGFVVSDNGKDLIGKISPELAEAQAGNTYSLFQFDSTPSRFDESFPITLGKVTLEKDVDQRLGNAQLPDWIADPSLAVFREKNIRIGLERALYIPDFNRYPVTDRQNFFSTVSSRTLGFINQPGEIDGSTLRLLSYGIFGFESGLALLMAAIGLATTKRYRKEFFATMIDYGANQYFIFRLQLSHLFPYLFAIISGSVIGRMLVVPVFVGRALPEKVEPGLIWLTPVFVAIIILIVIYLVRYPKLQLKGN
ncbi:hypothetical protein [Boudabousia marimammalium]|uniref:ABC3 transporter permease protein domain-containing protein n=1 Tax=Boudabousia marimammalium TaxID=156892 RepID=A0A1Q5PSI2_9ACTO|nr:hypothetical protein [Boudabousia marimammalium]OKL50493.1 hypothetical protein BM477_00520 [Boudabousia marimammalium]